MMARWPKGGYRASVDAADVPPPVNLPSAAGQAKPFGDVVVTKNYETGAVTLLRADDRIGISAALLAEPLDPEWVTFAWPLITFCGKATYRVVDFDPAARAFVATKEPGTGNGFAQFMAEHFNPGLVDRA